MRSHPSLLVALLFLLVLGVATGTSGARWDATRPGVAASVDAPTDVDAAVANRSAPANATRSNGTTMYVTPQSDGDAHWNVSTRFALDGANETAAFERLGKEFERGQNDVGYSVELFRKVARLAADETGRTMRIRQVDRSYHVGNGTGRLSLTFTWTNFSRTPGDRIVVRDAFLLDGGNSTWLWELRDDQRLVIQKPEGYHVKSSPNKGHENGTLRYEGPTSFFPGEIAVTYEKNSGQGPSQESFDWRGLLGIVLLLFVVSTGGAGLYVLAQRRDEESSDDAPPAEEQTFDRAGSLAPEPDASDGDTDPELLSDEERVEHMLRRNGGRMKQADIVTETNWSNAKVSQLLSSMADEGQVDKLRIGRENLITLPDEEVGDFDEE
ncbi:helix-turn-helix transcriptional regulator [Halomicrococcus sp. SG-WS-1]|uniref:helix-turn-helix transcriptional regulator n=1 Tax=Halomicrococcus sp. SG-WS-1 TaxID=3439057 RepID=UPI003F79CD2B